MEQLQQNRVSFSSQFRHILGCLASLEAISSPEEAEEVLHQYFRQAPDPVAPQSPHYLERFNEQLYRYVLKHYKHQEERVCLWRFIKRLHTSQLYYKEEPEEVIRLGDALLRMYFYSDPLDDLTCLFIPVQPSSLLKDYLEWIKSYFYNANYPTSLLWLYALDSSLSRLFPDEIVFLGRRQPGDIEKIMLPDFDYPETVLLKRYSERPDHFIQLEGTIANHEFHQIFTFLEHEYKDRCLSRTGRQDEQASDAIYLEEWEKFEDVLKFGVSDRHESGCVSFSDMRASTEFLTTYGKSIYLNKIQQPFFEKTKLISRKYHGRIDKFMGDNVMCVFLDSHVADQPHEDSTVLNNFFAIFDLCKILYELILKEGVEASRLGLRSGVTYGEQILRSNLGNEFVRDFTVTGETVNLAARLEHISINELKMHNKMYFQNALDRFAQISQLMTICKNFQELNDDTRSLVRDFTLYQNICSNLDQLQEVKFDIRFNNPFYFQIKKHLNQRGYQVLNAENAELYGYDEYKIDGFFLKFYSFYYNPKGFSKFEKIRVLPLETKVLRELNLWQVLACC